MPEDEITFNVAACRTDIGLVREQLSDLVSECNKLVMHLTAFQLNNHDVPGTRISEDYKDLAVIFGPVGFNSFVDILGTYLDSIEETVNSFAKTTGQ